MPYNLTPAEARAAWIDALRSGRFKQCQFVLCDESAGQYAYCCLGVACELMCELEGPAFLRRETGGGIIAIYVDPINDVREQMILPRIVQEWLGLAGRTGEFSSKNIGLSFLNDEMCMTFSQIAAVIEKELPGFLADPADPADPAA